MRESATWEQAGRRCDAMGNARRSADGADDAGARARTATAAAAAATTSATAATVNKASLWAILDVPPPKRPCAPAPSAAEGAKRRRLLLGDEHTPAPSQPHPWPSELSGCEPTTQEPWIAELRGTDQRGFTRHGPEQRGFTRHGPEQRGFDQHYLDQRGLDQHHFDPRVPDERSRSQLLGDTETPSASASVPAQKNVLQGVLKHCMIAKAWRAMHRDTSAQMPLQSETAGLDALPPDELSQPQTKRPPMEASEDGGAASPGQPKRRRRRKPRILGDTPIPRAQRVFINCKRCQARNHVRRLACATCGATKQEMRAPR